MSEEKKVDISSWTASSLLPLPSGAVVRVRKRKLQNLIQAGVLPATLLGKLSQPAKDNGVDPDKLGEYLASLTEAYKAMAEHFVVEPRIVFSNSAEAGEVSIADVDDQDLQYLVRCFLHGTDTEQRRAADLARFRAERHGDHAGQDGAEVRAAAV